jgi:hypothetical protein
VVALIPHGATTRDCPYDPVFLFLVTTIKPEHEKDVIVDEKACRLIPKRLCSDKRVNVYA